MHNNIIHACNNNLICYTITGMSLVISPHTLFPITLIQIPSQFLRYSMLIMVSMIILLEKPLQIVQHFVQLFHNLQGFVQKFQERQFLVLLA